MFPVTQDYKEKIKENNRVFECVIQIEHSEGTLYLNDKDLMLGTLIYTEASQASEEFTVGGVVASDLLFSIINRPEYEDVRLNGATVFINIGLQLREGAEAHFLQPSQPSKMPGFEERWEYVPLGRFHIDEVKRLRNTIEIKAIDNLLTLDKPYSQSTLAYPATLYQIYIDACNYCDIPIGSTDFPNRDHVVQKRPQGDLTFRDVISYLAELSGTFAKCDRYGALQLRWYEQTDIELSPSNRFNFKPSDDILQIKGVGATVDGTTYLVGSEDYVIDLSENPLLQGDYETVLPIIMDNIKDTLFTPYTSEWQGDPSLQAGDMIKQVDVDGNIYNTLVTKSIYKYRGKSTLEARGLPEISRGYKGSTNKKIAEIKRKVEVEIGDKLNNLEQAQLQATELIANILGGYVIKTEEAIYIADHGDLQQAVKVWKWGLGGFGYSESGVEGPYTTAITADGSIVAAILTASMINTGMLQSLNGLTYFDLDNAIIHAQHSDGSYTRLSPEGLDRYEGITKRSYNYLTYMDVNSLIFTGTGVESTTITHYVPTEFQGKDYDVSVILNAFHSYGSTVRNVVTRLSSINRANGTFEVFVSKHNVKDLSNSGGGADNMMIEYVYVITA